jgi:predicted adenylyl cyclase CyaB
MLEVELKSVVDDIPRRRAMVERAGGTLVWAGQLLDRRYDTSSHELAARDHVLRLRVYHDGSSSRAELDWKGPTGHEDGYKVREEIGVHVAEPDVLAEMLTRLGYEVTVEIEREIAQYELEGATVRFERYPRLDDLVEVEGTPEQIERAITAIGLPRDRFTSQRLPDFVRRFEDRTGQRAALCQSELRGERHYDPANA